MEGYAYWQGLATGAGLIIAIGAQNAFVLTQAVTGNHALAVALTCALLDLALIALGVAGVGTLVASSFALQAVACLGGAAFLLRFGWRSLRTALQNNMLAVHAASRLPLGKTLGAALAVSLLNPHVYLDTVVMLGSISGRYPGSGRFAFGAGAGSASVLWFLGLALVGRALAPAFRCPAVWRALYLSVCGMVWWVAASLLLDFAALVR